MNRKINFTMAVIEALKPPTGDRYYAYDSKLPGLALMVTANQKRFYVYKRIHGRPTRVPGGTFPATSAEAARAWARVLIGRIEQGENPIEERRAIRQQVTFGQAWTDYLEKHLKPHCKPRSRTEFERIHKKHLKAWETRSLATISTGDVAGLHVNVGEKCGHYMANRTLEVVKAVFNYAVEQMGWKHSNPCEGITRFNEEQRERVLILSDLGITRNQASRWQKPSSTPNATHSTPSGRWANCSKRRIGIRAEGQRKPVAPCYRFPSQLSPTLAYRSGNRQRLKCWPS
jgi:hypothetical protein